MSVLSVYVLSVKALSVNSISVNVVSMDVLSVERSFHEHFISARFVSKISFLFFQVEAFHLVESSFCQWPVWLWGAVDAASAAGAGGRGGGVDDQRGAAMRYWGSVHRLRRCR